MVSPEAWCDFRNQSMPRQDIEWFVDSNGNLKLRDKLSFTAAQTRRIAEQHERERAEWKRAQRRVV